MQIAAKEALKAIAPDIYKTVTRSLSFLAGVTVKSGLVTKMQKSISHGDWIEKVPKQHKLKLNRLAITGK